MLMFVAPLQEDISPEITIHFGTECLLLDCWAIHHQYSALCTAMGPGMSFQLRENEFVRDIFGLGPKICAPNDPAKSRTSKLERVSWTSVDSPAAPHHFNDFLFSSLVSALDQRCCL